MTKRLGLTLVEIIIVIGIIAILSTFASFNIVRSRNVVSLDSTVSSLINDIKSQQIQAMSGFTQAGVQNPYYGIYFDSNIEPNRYILFHTASYQLDDSANFPINLDQDNKFILPINLPDNQIVFASSSGEIKDFDPNFNPDHSYNITLKNINSNEQKTIYFNKFGVVYAIN
ncbi:MAG: prepilin-type N-terminal cleavage/methylation domain-containing protein [Candidatus Roizmanbacteria bacterium]